MELAIDTSLPVLPVETPEFSADPDPFLAAARAEHPWLARFSQGYVVHGYQACADLMADTKNMTCGFVILSFLFPVLWLIHSIFIIIEDTFYHVRLTDLSKACFTGGEHRANVFKQISHLDPVHIRVSG